MSIKAIKKSEFENMLQLLNNIEKIQQSDPDGELRTWEVKDLKERLQDKHERYLSLITDLSAQVEDFERLYKRLKVQYVPLTLRKMKSSFSTGSKEYKLIKESIQKTYR